MDSRHDAALPFAGWTVAAPLNAGPSFQVCVEHLQMLGAQAGESSGVRCVDLSPSETVRLGTETTQPLSCAVPWTPFSALTGADEVTIQASSGLMQVHGGERGTPRRLGLDVASIATGTLATQGLLAARYAQLRGRPLHAVQTSVLQGALAYLTHHLAIGTCGGSFPFEPATDGQGPPFQSADGAWVELEALTGGAWIGFWKALGVAAAIASRAWLPFVYRYLAGKCRLPEALHSATRRVSADDLARAATANGLALCHVRTHHEVETDGSSEPWTFRQASPVQAGVAATSESTPQHGAGPLAGVRVVELTSRLQGPLAGQLLRQLGADIVKVEPRGGDFGRSSPPFAGNGGAAYLAYNRGKRVEELDYKLPADRARLIELVSGADVFLHNWPRGRAERLALDFATLSKCNARLVYAHASGWGATLPEPTAIAGDQLVQAYAGCSDLLSPDDEAFAPSRLTIVDTMGGLLSCEGILAALCMREHHGHGVHVETSLFGGALLLRNGARKRPSWSVLDKPIKTEVGHLVVRARCGSEKEHLAALCGVSRREPADIDEASIAQCLAAKPAEDWLQPLADAGIAAAVVREDMTDVPNVWAQAGLVERAADLCWVPAAPWSFSELPSSSAVSAAHVAAPRSRL